MLYVSVVQLGNPLVDLLVIFISWMVRLGQYTQVMKVEPQG